MQAVVPASFSLRLCALALSLRRFNLPRDFKRQIQRALGGQLPGGTGTDRLRQMERARNFLISLCRGTASLRPVCGLLQME